MNLFGTLFNADIEDVPKNLKMEVTEMQFIDLLKSKSDADDISIVDFYKKYLLLSGKFPNLVEHAKKMVSLTTVKHHIRM